MAQERKSLHLIVPNVDVLFTVADAVAAEARTGSLIALSGPLGAGKTAFARAFIIARAKRAGQTPPTEVPSPTYTLAQTYAIGVDEICHFDLYRISSPDECAEIGFDDALACGIVLVEWPDRLGPMLPIDRLNLDFDLGLGGGETRVLTLAAAGDWQLRMPALEALLSAYSMGT